VKRNSTYITALSNREKQLQRITFNAFKQDL